MTVRRRVGALALAALVLLGAAIATAGPDAIPASGLGGGPGWVRGLYGDGLGVGGGALIWLERGALVAYAAVLLCAPALPSRWLWIAMSGLVAAFAASGPLLSLDVFSYASYARLEALHGLNPYEAVPADVPGDSALPFLIDNRDVSSAYGPLFTLVTLPLAQLGLGWAVFSLKAVAAASVLGTAGLAARLAVARGLDPRPAAALVALNPVVLVHVVGGGHNDALAALLMAAGASAAVAGAAAGGAAGLVAAVAIKASSAFLLPFALIQGWVRDRRLLVGIAVLGLLAAGAALLAFGPPLGSIWDVAAENQRRGTSLSLPSLLADELGAGRSAVRDLMRDLSLAACLVLLGGVWLRGWDWIRAGAWAGFLLLAGSNYLPPWYLILPLPLVAVSRDRSLVVASVLLTALLLRQQVPGLGA